jgi:hypothetical protein
MRHRKLIFCLCFLFLSGCDDKGATLAQCQLQFRPEEFKAQEDGVSAQQIYQNKLNYVMTCMRSKGYLRVKLVIQRKTRAGKMMLSHTGCLKSAIFQLGYLGFFDSDLAR